MSAQILVTGAAGALGRSVVERFLGAGERVLATDHDRRALDALAEALEAGDRLALHAADLAQGDQVAALFDAADSAAGTPAAVVHLVGGFRYSPLAETSDEDWAFLRTVNLDVTFRVVREACRRFRRAGGGALVAVSAPAALAAEAGVGAYAATKAGVLRLVEAAAREMAAFGGRANAVLPGTMDTAANRRAMPDQDPAGWVTTAAVASQIHYLTTPEAAAVNGAALRVPGPTL